MSALLLAVLPAVNLDVQQEAPYDGLWGFLLIAFLVVASVLLFRSMGRHLRKVPASFDDPAAPAGPAHTAPRGGEGASREGTGADGEGIDPHTSGHSGQLP